ncbi:hypothetical protein [Metaclostridioides mangenotii]|uniref:DUF2254 domain-containing protein n=1 Tax=Metaclostridioides mangenotii TaxID=1540 RepID=A0ABS4E7X2_9FIRM|nr:hypothetical protein [Clostridioides mangenotii]MBP1854041.1 hypothetical protein [Clostridioides mangenotii]
MGTKNPKFNKSKLFRIIAYIILISLLVICLIIESNIFNLPSFILINNQYKRDIMYSIFTAQVSISTLGIALIAILSGVLKDTIYGVNIIRYITNDTPVLFKHKNCIILEFILILISYILLALDYYNLLIYVFFISIIIIMSMAIDILKSLYVNDQLKYEIYNYIKNIFSEKSARKYYKEQFLKGLKDETLINIEKNNTYLIKENISFFEEIFEITIKNDDIYMMEIIEDNLSNVYNSIFEKKDSSKTVIALYSIQKIYKICNDNNNGSGNKKIYLDVYEKVFYNIFSAIATMILDDRIDQKIIFNMQYDLFNNMNFIEKNGDLRPQNNFRVKFFSARLYDEMKRKGFGKYNPILLRKVKEDLFDYHDGCIGIYAFNEQFRLNKNIQVNLQLCEYTKVLIDNYEDEVLKETYFRKMVNSMHPYNKIEKKLDNEYLFIIIIYLYYLIEFEYLVKSEERSKLIKLIDSNNNKVKSFLKTNFIPNDRYLLEAILKTWERTFKSDPKVFIMDNVVVKFIVFYILKLKGNNFEILKENLKKFITYENLILIINEINYSSDFLEEYKKFKKLFFAEDLISEDLAAEESINMLRESINMMYKEIMINGHSDIDKNNLSYEDTKESIEKDLLKKFNEFLGLFKKDKSKCKGKRDIIRKKIEIPKAATDINIIQISVNLLYDELIKRLIYIIKNNIYNPKVSNRDEDNIIKFLEYIEKNSIETDVVIGYDNCSTYLDEDTSSKLEKFGQDKQKIDVNYFSNFMYALNSKQIYFEVINISVGINKVSVYDFCNRNNIEKNNSGKYILVKENIEFLFNEDELNEYLENNIRDIVVEIDYVCELTDDCIGVGIIFNR